MEKKEKILNLTIIISISLLFAETSIAQWTKQKNGTSEDGVYADIAAGGPMNAYAVGVMDMGMGNTKGVIQVTTNGGTSWNMAMPDSRLIAMYLSAWAPTPEKCYVGGISKVFITENSGVTWRESQHPSMAGMKPVIGIGGFGENFVVATAGSSIFVSHDSGLTWENPSNPLGDIGLSYVFFVDENTGWIVGGGADYDENQNLIGYKDGAIIQTTDGGATWVILRQGEEKGFGTPSFVNQYDGWITSNSMSGPLVEKTNDGGHSWQALTVPVMSAGTLDGLYQVYFFDKCEGFLLGGDSQAKRTGLFYTIDGGKTWEEVDTEFTKLEFPVPFPIPVYSRCIAMDFVDRTTGWITGTYEFIGHYSSQSPGPDCGTEPENPPSDASTDGGQNESEGGSGCGCTIIE